MCHSLQTLLISPKFNVTYLLFLQKLVDVLWNFKKSSKCTISEAVFPTITNLNYTPKGVKQVWRGLDDKKLNFHNQFFTFPSCRSWRTSYLMPLWLNNTGLQVLYPSGSFCSQCCDQYQLFQAFFFLTACSIAEEKAQIGHWGIKLVWES